MATGDRLFVFRCGCMKYDPGPKIGNRRMCHEHRSELVEVHNFCVDCGLNIISGSHATKKKLCDYPVRFQLKTGGESMVGGCAGIRQRVNAYDHYRKNHLPRGDEPKAVGLRRKKAEPGRPSQEASVRDVMQRIFAKNGLNEMPPMPKSRFF